MRSVRRHLVVDAVDDDGRRWQDLAETLRGPGLATVTAGAFLDHRPGGAVAPFVGLAPPDATAVLDAAEGLHRERSGAP